MFIPQKPGHAGLSALLAQYRVGWLFPLYAVGR